MSKISNRVMAAIMMLLVCLLGLSWLAWRNMAQQVEAMEHVYSDHVVAIRNLKVVSDKYAVDIVDAAHKARSGALSMEQSAKAVKSAINEINELWIKYLERPMHNEERTHVEKAVPLLKVSNDAAEKLLKLLLRTDRAKLGAFIEFIDSEMYPGIDPGTEAISGLIEAHLKYANLEFIESKALERGATRVLIIAVLISVLTGLSTAIFVMKRLVVDLGHQIRTMESMADGNLDLKVTGMERRDELGTIARALDQYCSAGMERRRLRVEAGQAAEMRAERAERIEAAITLFEAEVALLLGSVNEHSDRLLEDANSMESTASMASDQIRRISEAASEMANSMSSLSLAGEDMSRSIRIVGEQASDAANHARIASQDAKSSAGAAEQLGAASTKIIEVVELIRAIATKTNLLALNATIEAARAGEQGKGFAVVASEVKDLANQTAKAVDTVSEHISAIQAAAGSSSSSFYSITNSVSQIDNAASAIATSVADQSARAMSISENVLMAARSSEETAQTVAVVSEAAERTDHTAKSVKSTSLNLYEKAAEIRVRIDRFLEDVRAA